MKPLDLINIPVISNGQISDDGQYLYYLQADADWSQNHWVASLWRSDLKTGKSNRLTWKNKVYDYQLSPDGETIALLRDDNKEKRQIFLMSVNGGEARQLSRLERKPSAIKWSHDGQWIYFIQSRQASKSEKKAKSLKEDVSAFGHERFKKQLWRINRLSGEAEPVIKGDFSVRGFQITKNGKEIIYSRANTSSIDDSLNAELWLYRGKDKKHLRLTHNENTPEKKFEPGADAKRFLFLSWVDDKGEVYQEDNLFVAEKNKGKSRLLLGDFDHEIRDAHFSADAKKIYFVANLGVHSELFSVELHSGEIKQLTSGKHAIKEWTYLPKTDEHLLRLQSARSKGDFWRLRNTQKGAQLSQLTHVYDYLAKDFRLPRQAAVSWKGDDGVVIEGLVTFPLNFKKGKRYPLVVQTHGGPRSASQYDMFHTGHYLPVLSAMGYMTLQPNYRGSTGYGDEFVRDMVGGYFKHAHLDVMSGVDFLVKKGWADPDKLVKMGWSAGGHLTNKVVTFTDRFKAASSGAGASNWLSMYAQSDTRVYRTPWFNGNPWQADANIALFWNHSPLKDVSQVKTPTLILVGEKDVRVPKEQSIEFYRGLQANGVDSKLYIAPREPHGWRELRHRLFKINVELDWYEKHLFNRDYQWQKAPEKIDKKTSD